VITCNAGATAVEVTGTARSVLSQQRPGITCPKLAIPRSTNLHSQWHWMLFAGNRRAKPDRPRAA